MTKIHQSLRGRVVNHEYSRLPQMFDSYQDMQARTPEKYAQDHFGPFPESEHQKPYENPDQDYQELEALYTPWETPPYIGPINIDLGPAPVGETKVCKALSDICYCPNETKSAAVRFTDKECCSRMTYDLIHTAGTFTIKATCSKITITASEDASGSIRFTAHRSGGDLGTDLTAEQCGPVQTNVCLGDDEQPTTISYDQTMSVGTEQTLSVLHPKTGFEYKWKITGGGGTLSTTKGTSTVYTAPAENPNCSLNPTITLSVDGKGCYSPAGGTCDTARIGLNGFDRWAAGMFLRAEDVFEELKVEPPVARPEVDFAVYTSYIACNGDVDEWPVDQWKFNNATAQEVWEILGSGELITVDFRPIGTWSPWYPHQREDIVGYSLTSDGTAIAGGCCPHQLM